MPNRRVAVGVGVILLLSLAVRLHYIVSVNVVPLSDMADYNMRAMTLLTQHTFQTGSILGATYRPPGYILFLAGIYQIFGHHLKVVYFIQALLSVASLYAIYLLGAKVFNKETGLLALFLSSLYIPFIAYTGILLSESLFLFLFLYGVYAFIKGVETKKTGWFILGGLLIGYAALTRSLALLVPILFFGWWVWQKGKGVLQASSIKNGLIFLLFMGLVIAPWTVRNYMEQKSLVLVDTISGLNLLIGNNDFATGKFTNDIVKIPAFNQAKREGATDAERDQMMKNAAIQWIMEHPGKFSDLSLARLGMYLTISKDWVSIPYHWERIPFYSDGYEQFTYWILIGLGLMGMVWVLIKKRSALLIVGIAGYFFAVLSVFYFQTRYRLPAMPFVILLAACVLMQGKELVKSKIK